MNHGLVTRPTVRRHVMGTTSWTWAPAAGPP